MVSLMHMTPASWSINLQNQMLRAGRARAGLTQDAVAESVWYYKEGFHGLESAGKHAPSLATLKRYAEAGRCDLRPSLAQGRMTPNYPSSGLPASRHPLKSYVRAQLKCSRRNDPESRIKTTHFSENIESRRHF